MLEYGSSLIKIGSNYTARGCQESRSTCISRIRATELEPRRSCVSFALWRTSAPPFKLLFRPSPCPPPSTFKVPSCGMKTKLFRNLPVQTSSAGAWFAHVQHEISATFSTHPGGRTRRQLVILAGCAPYTPPIATTRAVADRADAQVTPSRCVPHPSSNPISSFGARGAAGRGKWPLGVGCTSRSPFDVWPMQISFGRGARCLQCSHRAHEHRGHKPLSPGFCTDPWLAKRFHGSLEKHNPGIQKPPPHTPPCITKRAARLA
jgi:hypothetical protein